MTKTPVRQQNPVDRRKNFREVSLGYSEDEALAEARRCIECGACIAGCPVGVDIPSFIRKIKDKDFEGACRIIKESNCLPSVCGRVCPQETQCEAKCVLGQGDDPIAVGALERFAAQYDTKKGGLAACCGKSVAVVGSGPAGLTCAAELAKLGYRVTVFESLHKPGGVLQYGIPAFRLPRPVLMAEIDYVKSLGVEIKCNTLIGLTYDFRELRSDFDAVFLACGAGLPYFLGVEGESLNGVYSANEFLLRVNLMRADRFPEYDTPINIGSDVAVVGAGNVAMDAARCALRLGADNVSILYRRSEAEMPARDEEIEHAKQEGIDFRLLTNPVKLHGEDGWVKRIECVEMCLGEPDESGRCRPLPMEGSCFVLPAETVVIAIGQAPNPVLIKRVEGLETDKSGRIKVDENLSTSLSNVFAGGDVASRDATVISAMSQGNTAAEKIHEKLS
ncbi:MAG: NADPH-dependent glutamate synthase [Candidatus Altiarchaeales archaeon]|nr:NADPH-dependent glutamate synthase [Candidatus Altiarchaeales archaeon]